MVAMHMDNLLAIQIKQNADEKPESGDKKWKDELKLVLSNYYSKHCQGNKFTKYSLVHSHTKLASFAVFNVGAECNNMRLASYAV